MVRLTQSLRQWLFIHHPGIVPLIMFGHVELFTPKMKQQYLEWCQSEEGRQHLKGGSKYVEENNFV